MRVVAAHNVVLAPQRCAVLPYVGPSRGCRFIDTGAHLTDGFHDRVYVSETAVLEMARMLGLPAKGEYREAKDRVQALEAQLTRANAELVDLREKFNAIDVLASADFRARKKPGRTKAPA